MTSAAPLGQVSVSGCRARRCGCCRQGGGDSSCRAPLPATGAALCRARRAERRLPGALRLPAPGAAGGPCPSPGPVFQLGGGVRALGPCPSPQPLSRERGGSAAPGQVRRARPRPRRRLALSKGAAGAAAPAALWEHGTAQPGTARGRTARQSKSRHGRGKHGVAERWVWQQPAPGGGGGPAPARGGAAGAEGPGGQQGAEAEPRSPRSPGRAAPERRRSGGPELRGQRWKRAESPACPGAPAEPGAGRSRSLPSGRSHVQRQQFIQRLSHGYRKGSASKLTLAKGEGRVFA